MDNEFYNAFGFDFNAFSTAPAALVTVAKTVGIENEKGRESVKSDNRPRRISIFKELGSDTDTDDEEEYINKARRQLDSYSFN
ncbi:hypothetical protein Hanom_Chr16g01456021 [Helianthus anomalus]